MSLRTEYRDARERIEYLNSEVSRKERTIHLYEDALEDLATRLNVRENYLYETYTYRGTTVEHATLRFHAALFVEDLAQVKKHSEAAKRLTPVSKTKTKNNKEDK